LQPETSALVTETLLSAAGRGVAVRLAYNVDHERPVAVPPPPLAEPSLIESIPVPTRGIPGIPDLMHHKYVIRDESSVWTGSTNWTDDSWAREENVIVVAESQQLASRFMCDFEQLWERGLVEGTGAVEPNPLRVDGRRVRAWFTPVYGDALAHRIAKHIGRARQRVRIASPVITSGPIIGTLAEVAAGGRVDLAGAVDATQIADVIRQWQQNERSAWKLPLLRAGLARAPFSGKHSTPWAPDNVHDYMHAKLTVTDDVVFVGSYNLSHSGEQNAENVLEIEDAELADRLAAYVDEIRARYPPVEL
jgi:phosphatidylserine/phosphatidylglycerophosphate/cardiolipin synthase-like enzyme